MPLYEYQCDTCGHRFEKIQKFSDPLVSTCPACGGPVQKLLSSPAIQFKGSGWYITDYARSGKDGGKSDGATTKSDAKGEKSDAAKGDSGSAKGTTSESASSGTTPAASSSADSSSSASAKKPAASPSKSD